MTQEKGWEDDWAPSWKANRRQLIDLHAIATSLIMQPFQAHSFYFTGKLIESLCREHGTKWLAGTGFALESVSNEKLNNPMSPGDVDGLKVIVGAIKQVCSTIKLKRSIQYATHIQEELDREKKPTYRDIGALLRELDKHIRWDMTDEKFMYVPPESAKYYKLQIPISPRVLDAFPDAHFDLQEAGNCLCFGAYTGCGLHLVRAAEVALWELGRDRQIPLAQNGRIEFAEWGTIIGEIETAVKVIQQWPNSQKKEDAHKFYNRALVEIRSFNDGLRRHIAHVRKDRIPLEEDEAIAYWGHVSRFMDTLAEKISTGKYMPLEWT